MARLGEWDNRLLWLQWNERGHLRLIHAHAGS